MRHINVFFIFLLLLLIEQKSATATELDSTFIEDFAHTYLTEQYPSTEEEKVRVSVAELDPRIKIKPCNIPLTANIPEKNNSINVNIKISCDESTPWQIYLSAKVEITKAIFIAKKTILKGERLDENNVELAYIATNRIRGSKLTDEAIVFGAKAKRRIGQGRAINKRSICLICKGDVVTIIAASDSFSIKTRGIALSSGNINEQIRIENSRSEKVITARVKTINQVEINL
ncbi:flagellar basal body P-ring formation chaperone FlgA [Colwellia ponticola]|uniref:Flagella basal body P-ring formation protein FlgA n=1 Tax=Colwellia ponticola TaxID=2304625 RepID=A0A8H2JJF9_9GAMM|nr:flagellar basal body P-ring formation chaperone FlgA [Colwellia ponticola]TMM43097.1 flagellar basal body P-ring formation protein FlgA [Colwellia ponticola]